MEESKNSRKEGVKNWLKNPYNVAFLIIMLLSILFRAYYFDLTKEQPLWWDESEYMAGAKGFAGIVDFALPSLRSPGFSLLASAFYMIGMNEVMLRFLLAFVPSIIVLFLTYFCIREMYPDRRIALISLIILSLLWEHLFYSNRFHTENLSLIFQLLATFVLFKGYLKKKDIYFIKHRYSIAWIVLFSLIAVFFRPGNIIFIPAILLFMLILYSSSKYSGKKTATLAGSLIALFLIVYIYISSLPREGLLVYLSSEPISFNSIIVFKGFYESFVPLIPSLWYYAFIIGFLAALFTIISQKEKLKELKDNENHLELKSDIFNILLIVSVLAFFIFIMRVKAIEYRWFFPFLIAMLAITSKGITTFSTYAGSFINKKSINVLIIIIVGLGFYTQLVHVDSLIKSKVDSYSQVKDSGLWIKQNSNKEDSIVSASKPQHIYYSERKVYNFWELAGDTESNEAVFDQNLEKTRPRYLIISAFENIPAWGYDYSQTHAGMTPVKVYFADAEEKQAILVIYEIDYNNFGKVLNNSS